MRILKAALPALAMLTVAGAAQAQAIPRIGYIDSARILAESSEAQAAQERFNQEVTQYQTQLQTMDTELQGLMAAYEQQSGTLSDEARQQRETEILQKRADFEQRARQLEGEMGQRRNALIEPVMQQINTVIEDIRKEGGYSLIFDVAAGAILAVDPSLDVTPEVLRRLSATSDGNP